MQNSSHPSFRTLPIHPSTSQMTLVFTQVTHTSPPFFAAIIISQKKQRKQGGTAFSHNSFQSYLTNHYSPVHCFSSPNCILLIHIVLTVRVLKLDRVKNNSPIKNLAMASLFCSPLKCSIGNNNEKGSNLDKDANS